MPKRKIICCNVLKEELIKIPSEGDVDWDFLPMALHNQPAKLGQEVQELINASPGYDLLVLAYGLCGNGTENLIATHCPLVIPRVHDCIPLLMGSNETYQELRKANIGTYFLSAGWTEGGKGILEEHRYMSEKYGLRKAAMLEKTIYGHYNRLLYIKTNHPRRAEGLVYAKEAAGLLSLQLEEMAGRAAYLEALLNGPWDEKNFIRVEKGDLIRAECFYNEFK